MANDEDITLSFQLHNNGLKTNDNISVGFTTSVSVVEFILISTLVVFWVFLLNCQTDSTPVAYNAHLDLLVCHAVTYTCIELV